MGSCTSPTKTDLVDDMKNVSEENDMEMINNYCPCFFNFTIFIDFSLPLS